MITRKAGPAPKSLNEALVKSTRWRTAIFQLINGCPIPDVNRHKVSALYFWASLEHYVSICDLADTGRFGSAAALMRPQFEMTLRGLWIGRCAKDKTIDKFMESECDPPGALNISIDLDQKKVLEHEIFERLYKVVYGVMSDHVHGGSNLVMRSLRGCDDLVLQFTDKEKIEIVSVSTDISLLGAASLASVAGGNNLWNKMNDAHTNIFGF